MGASHNESTDGSGIFDATLKADWIELGGWYECTDRSLAGVPQNKQNLSVHMRIQKTLMKIWLNLYRILLLILMH